jgi:hypothetical protein
LHRQAHAFPITVAFAAAGHHTFAFARRLFFAIVSDDRSRPRGWPVAETFHRAGPGHCRERFDRFPRTVFGSLKLQCTHRSLTALGDRVFL